MDASEALTTLATLIQLPDGDPLTSPGTEAPETKAAIIAIAQASAVDTTSFIEGDPTERFLEYTARALKSYGKVPQMAVRALFFKLSTDPGDVADDGLPDLSADQTPRAGMLSAVGAGFYGTERGGQTRATSFVTIRNTGSAVSSPFSAGQLAFEYSTATRDDGGKPTYTSTADPSVYTGIGATLTLAAGASVTLPVQCDQLGTYGNAAANQIDTCVTQSFGTFTVTASTTAIGEDREERAAYITRCELEGDSNAPGGPTNAYLRAATTGRDGKKLQRFDGTGPVTITDAYVSPDSSTGAITIYFRGLSGAVDDVDVSSANANITGIPLGVITDPIGVLPDTVAIGPTATDPNTGGPGGASCTNTTIAVTFSVKIRASRVPGGASPGTYTSGGSPPANVLALGTAANDALSAYLLSTGVGGLDQVAGAGVVYTADLPGVVRDSVSGFYDPIVTLPSTSTTAIALGHIATLGALTWTITVVSG